MLKYEYKNINILLILLLLVLNLISDEGGTTVCQLRLSEREMTAGGCMTLEVYAKQYGVQSEKKIYSVCYDGKG